MPRLSDQEMPGAASKAIVPFARFPRALRWEISNWAAVPLQTSDVPLGVGNGCFKALIAPQLIVQATALALLAAWASPPLPPARYKRSYRFKSTEGHPALFTPQYLNTSLLFILWSSNSSFPFRTVPLVRVVLRGLHPSLRK